MGKKRAVTASFLSFALVLSSAPVLQADAEEREQSTRSIVAKNIEAYKKQLQQELKKIEKEKDEKVVEKRVIVELESAPAITYAQKNGVKFSEVPKSKQKSLISDAESKQKTVQNKIKSAGVAFKKENSFTTIFNGFSGHVLSSDIDKIKQIENVKNVYEVNEYERPEIEPNMVNSNEMVEATNTWREFGYKGEGQIVSVIDTGIDVNHRDMVLSETTEETLTKSIVDTAKSENALVGQYYTEKVPYGYNYFDKNSEIRDLGAGASEHGMHVSGTVGANGDVENSGLKGVAPEAQILAMKVFGNNQAYGSTWGDIYVKAIDDSIILGADVINMSLGSTAGFVRPNDPEQQAIARATEAGIFMAISAGNSDRLGGDYLSGNLANSPDKGLVGSPSLSKDSTSVASLENTAIMYETFSYNLDGEEKHALFLDSGNLTFKGEFKDQELEFVDVGLGLPTNFTPEVIENLQGKVALIERGNNPFTEKIQNAQKAGAIGVIVYNSVSGGEGLVNMQYPADGNIPAIFIPRSAGVNLKEVLATEENKTITFSGERNEFANPNAGRMSDFTSWGVTPNLDFKPEITAPGGNILSTLQNNEYGLMSGTSMAAPHVAGGAALILERVEEEFPNVTGKERVQLAKTLLMNTSVLQKDEDGYYYSPRRQGSGLMNLYAASSTPVYVTAKGTPDAKVALKEVDDTFSYEVTLHNVSDEDVTYSVAQSLLTDYENGGYIFDYSQEIEIDETDVSITSNGSEISEITVPADGTIDVKVNVDLTDATVSGGKDPDTVFENGYFVEGFLEFANVEDEGTDTSLNIPFVGYNGDWNAPSILDSFNEEEAYYGNAGFLYEGKTSFYYHNDEISISPKNSDAYYDEVMPILSFLRNAKSVEYSVVDADGKQLRKLYSEQDVRKHYTAQSPYSIKSIAEWDGKVNRKFVADGVYYYQIKAAIDYDGKEAQVYKIPILVDNTAPTVENVEYDKEGKKVTFTSKDNGSGLSILGLFVNGQLVETKPAAADQTKEATVEFTLANELPKGATISAVALDAAFNEGYAELKAIGDSTLPIITITSFESTEYFNTGTIPVQGYVSDDSELNYVKIDGEEVAYTFNASANRYDFSTTLEYNEDGQKDIRVEVEDAGGNKTEFITKILIDSQKPSIEFSEVPGKVDIAEEDPVITIKVKDNSDAIRVTVNDDEVYKKNSDLDYGLKAAEHTIDNITLPLEEGVNEFEIKAVDLVGNETIEVITIEKSYITPEISKVNLSSTKNISPSNPLTITASASKTLEWDVKVVDSKNKTVKAFSKVTASAFTNKFTPARSLANGSYKVIVNGKDSSGKTAKTVTKSFTVTQKQISVSSVSLSRTKDVSTKRPVTVTAKAPEKVKWDVKVIDSKGKTVHTFKSVNAATFTGKFTPSSKLADGTYKVIATGKDVANNTVKSKTTSFTVYQLQGKVTSVVAKNSSGKSVTSFTTKQKIAINATLNNLGPGTLSSEVLVRVVDSKNKVVASSLFKKASVSAGKNKTYTLNINAGRLKKGTYKVQVYSYSNYKNKTAAAKTHSSFTFTVK